MQTPGGETGRAVERIMAAIRPHIRPDDSGSAIHYNRTYEAVTAELERFKVQITAYNAAVRGTE